MGMWRQGEAVIISCLSSARPGAILCALLRSSDRWFDTLFFALSGVCHVYIYVLHDYTFGVGAVYRFLGTGGAGSGMYMVKSGKISIFILIKSVK